MEEKKGPCRDFERGVCSRGNRCKFYHPDNIPQPMGDKKLPICKDFQNKGCDRNKCKFLHVTQDEEAHYNSTGVLPHHGGRSDIAPNGNMWGGGGPSANSPVSKDKCKDFLNGICQRGNKCKFAHVNDEAGGYPGAVGMGAGMGAMGYGKRRRDDYGLGDSLVEENEMLRRKISDLQRQVIDLRQMNDTLYDQNTRYRNQLRGPVTPANTLDLYGTAKSVSYPSTALSLSSSAYDGYTKF